MTTRRNRNASTSRGIGVCAVSGARARRRAKKVTVQVEESAPLTKLEQLAAACRVYEIPRILRNSFTFSKSELLNYIEANPEIAHSLYGKSLDQRWVPSAFMVEAAGGFTVGWFDDERKELRFHHRIEDAATDFVLRFWNMPRD
jgi:hypothetical protein